MSQGRYINILDLHLLVVCSFLKKNFHACSRDILRSFKLHGIKISVRLYLFVLVSMALHLQCHMAARKIEVQIAFYH